MANKAPWWLSHKPVISIDYESCDAKAGDAKFLSIGKSTWNEKDYSAKVWRQVEETGHWSRQGEELPLWRVLDLATLVVAAINGKTSNLNEFIQDPNSIDEFKSFIEENLEILAPKMHNLRDMLKETPVMIKSEGEPNIFSFATSELSQDAMFAWLISWSDSKYANSDKSLHVIAQDFARLVMGKDKSFEIKQVSVGRQWQNIDVWAEINNDTFLVIEDKTGTSVHDNQLNRYKEIAENEYKGKRSDLCFAYIKTENEPDSTLKAINKCGYKTIERRDILDCLNSYSGQNPLLISYRNHLQQIEDSTSSFLKNPACEWGWYAWQGFYKMLERKLDITAWDYVSNPSGGFLGIWWHFVDIDDGKMYLQIEQGKLCFKINYEGDKDRSSVRWEYHSKLMSKKGEDFPEITRPERFGAGAYMTIAVVSQDSLFGKGLVDMDGIINKLENYQSLIDLCCRK